MDVPVAARWPSDFRSWRDIHSFKAFMLSIPPPASFVASRFQERRRTTLQDVPCCH